MKERKKLLLLLVPVLMLLSLLLLKPGYFLYRELSFRLGQPTAGERTVYAYAQEMGISYGRYPLDLIDLLDANPETEAFVLNYPFRKETPPDIRTCSRETVPLFLQWDPMWGYTTYGSSYLAVTGCGPTCLSMVGYYLTGNILMTPDQVAAFAQKNGYYAPGYGSSWTLISEGCQELGLSARELPLVEKKMVDALEEGHPIILALGEGDFTSSGHYIVLTGMEGDAFRVNDPNSRIRSQRLWTYEELAPQIRNIWAISLK